MTHRRVLAEVAAAVEVETGAIRWFGEAEPAGRWPDETRSVLQERLYADWYMRGAPAPRSRWDPPVAPLPTGLADSVDAARGLDASIQHGWRVQGPDSVIRGGLHVMVRPDEHDGAPGDRACLRLPPALPGLVPGHHLVLGRRDLDGSLRRQAMRVYLHATPRALAKLVAAIGGALDKNQLSYRLKMVNAPAAFRRCDAAVLYTGMNDGPRVVDLLRGLHPAMASALRHQTPPLTLRLAPGIGWAEDPGNLDSFGHHRCGLIADGLVAAAERGHHSLTERVRAVETAFQRAGFDSRRPYLGPGSVWEPKPFA